MNCADVGSYTNILVSGILKLSLKGHEFRSPRKRNLGYNKERRLERGKYMHKGGRCNM